MKYTLVAACLASCSLAMHHRPMDNNRMIVNVNGVPIDVSRMAAYDQVIKEINHRRSVFNDRPMDVNRMMVHDNHMNARNEKQPMGTVRYATYDTQKMDMSKYADMDRLVDLARMVVKEGNQHNARSEKPMDSARWAEMEKLLNMMRMSMGKNDNHVTARTDKPMNVMHMLNTDGRAIDASKMANLDMDSVREFLRLANKETHNHYSRANMSPTDMNRMVQMMHESVMALAHELYGQQVNAATA